jgi:hypothetical protein
MFPPAKAGGGSAGPRNTSPLGNRRSDFHTATATTATGITIPQNQPVMEYAFRGQGHALGLGAKRSKHFRGLSSCVRS